ncbi:UDP-glycosyltransferase 90A1-like [Silene latifolia]|uniref:UDP-glycosyltransferase 90A1-like n=1 Tax=Silene latifolia TaxID=37657 RepID=UPI003D76FBF5
MTSSLLHVALFPFMSKGHMIPLLQLVKLIHIHKPEAKFTIFTTPANEPFIVSSLTSIPPKLINIICLCFPPTSQIIAGVESTDQLPSMSLFTPFLYATETLQPYFETALKSLLPITCLISDGFLHWTLESASKFNIPRLAFYGMNNYSFVLCTVMVGGRLFSKVESEEELITVPGLRWVQVTRNHFDSPWNEQEPQGPVVDYIAKCVMATSNSYGLLVNSFDELESKYLDFWNLNFQPKAWCIGPLCLAHEPKLDNCYKPNWVNWLDNKWAERRHVLYVAFGTQAEISNEQLKEIMIGLENSRIDFLWALRIKPNQEEIVDGLEERVQGRGLIVRGWVDQRMILEHEAIQGHLTHCGWNSTTESICANVPILAMPMLAEQHLNAKMVVKELKVGLRVETCNGSTKGFVKSEELKRVIFEFMGKEHGEMVRENVEELSKVAKKSIQEGGSSWINLESLLTDLQMGK